jgi:hypothetical protein
LSGHLEELVVEERFLDYRIVALVAIMSEYIDDHFGCSSIIGHLRDRLFFLALLFVLPEPLCLELGDE